MKFTVATALTAAAVAAAGSTESKPFTLSIVSSDKSVDGKHITWCHSGAGYNSLCLSDSKGDKITLDTGDSSVDPNKAGNLGKLTLSLPSGKYTLSACHLLSIAESLIKASNRGPCQGNLGIVHGLFYQRPPGFVFAGCGHLQLRFLRQQGLLDRHQQLG